MGEEQRGEDGEEEDAAEGRSSLSDDCFSRGSRSDERPRPMGERRRGLRPDGEVAAEEGEGWVAGGDEGEDGTGGDAKVIEGGSELGEDELSRSRSSTPSSSSPRLPMESGPPSPPPSAPRRGNRVREDGGGGAGVVAKAGGGVTRPILRSSSLVSSSLDDNSAGGRVTV